MTDSLLCQLCLPHTITRIPDTDDGQQALRDHITLVHGLSMSDLPSMPILDEPHRPRYRRYRRRK